MQTHENAPEHNKAAQVDFCWNVNYVQMNNIYSDVYNNGSPYQAYRAGFREGCKMSLEGGDVVDPTKLRDIHPRNYQRLCVWQTVGADTLNGLWAVYGARLGCVMTNLRRAEWDWKNVRDFEWHTKFWNEKVAPVFQDDTGTLCISTGYKYDAALLLEKIEELGDIIRSQLHLDIAEFNAESSKFFKTVYINPARVDPMWREDETEDTLE